MMFEKYRNRRKAKIVVEQQGKADEYILRLKNSAKGFSGMRHEGEGPFLSITEIRSLLFNELKRLDDERPD